VSDAPDPELRALFGFEDPRVTDFPTAAAPSTSAPPTTTSTTAAPQAWLRLPWSAATADAATVDLEAIGRRLDRWVPNEGELGPYREVVDQLLTALAAHRMDRVDPRLGPVYRYLVPAVAWQESCWRQFVERDGKVTFLLSATGDVGMMQVNRRVWRGFFDLHSLEWDAVYNAAAGAEILVQLLLRFGAKEAKAHVEDAARAVYSAYNAGPGGYRRYRSTLVDPRGRAIDVDFWEKYRVVAAGQAGDRVLCM
jgi:soluble lytic murein transglycosylase-like protein